MSRNRLTDETSPYLLQHKDNPVDWWAWGPEALQEAKSTGKPILLSIGYAACHWCHVMAHESFEDEETAKLMNELFVNIKVDREERPDIDAIYMAALHRLGQQGGWPLTMFLDAEGRPFWGGTYFPKTPRYGQPAFSGVLNQVSVIYRDQKDKVEHNAETLTQSLSMAAPASDDETADLTDTLIEDLTNRMIRAIDFDHGGVSGAPKFPQWSFFWLLWRGAMRYRQEDAQKAVELTLNRICQGGIFDHLGGGFARYSVDERWLVPHFEKMLYDNALLIDLLTEVYRETQNPLFQERVEQTVEWLEREMIAEGGGFAASLDADSEGEEGKFYVWTKDEIEAVLGADDALFFAGWYDVTPDGNWEEKTILNRSRRHALPNADEHARLSELRQKLLGERDKRVRPGWDDKVLADWNGLMIAALARASRVFAKPDWLARAEKAFAFIADKMVSDSRLHHAFRAGRISAPGTASDYANMIWAALRLHQATLNPKYLQQATTWAEVLDHHYWIDDGGGYSTSADDTSDVIVRLRLATDDATPNANAIMVSNFSALAQITGEQRYAQKADAILKAFSAETTANLIGHAGLVAAALDVIAPQHIVVAEAEDEATDQLVEAVNTLSVPGAVEYVIQPSIAGTLPDGLTERAAIGGKTTAYCCLGTSCSYPITELDDLITMVKQQRSA
jgi:uncharacterized protein